VNATAKAFFSRWHAFTLTGLLAGLCRGESATIEKDMNWRRGRIHVQRAFSEKASTILPCKDSEDRCVNAFPAVTANSLSRDAACNHAVNYRGSWHDKWPGDSDGVERLAADISRNRNRT